MIKLRSALLILLLVGGACGRNDDPSVPVPRSAASSASQDSQVSPEPGSCEKVKGGATEEADTHAFLRDVRASNRGTSDRIVFEFSPPASLEPAIPRFEIEEVKPPLTQDPSDEPMQVEGLRFFRVIFFGGTGVDETYTATYRGPKEMRLGLPMLKEAEQQGDFEATLSWVMGLGQLRCPQITELRDPPRLAIDFGH